MEIGVLYHRKAGTKFAGKNVAYHPFPFSEFKTCRSLRLDCERRLDAILADYGECTEKTFIDIGCANGYFLFSMALKGCSKAVGVDTFVGYVDVVNMIAEEKGLNVVAVKNLPKKEKFDIGMFLDLYCPENDSLKGFLEFMQFNVTKSYISGCNAKRDGQLKDKLVNMFDRVDVIFKGFQNRSIFVCEQHKGGDAR